MKAIKAIYQNGKVKLTEKPSDPGPVEVLIVFPEPSDDPWQEILDDPRPRPALARKIQQVREQIRKGKTKPLDLGQL
ncbi:MAG TPA: hypothetical protein VGZ47_10570 [Gemmataceae bacterium]|nr:hypothetical protein [Gemmataceae bacterium]